MFGQKKPKTEEMEQPERLHYTKYYEHDGALRAYANRAMVLACSMSLLAFLSLAFAIYVRMQPPTIIRVSADGESTVLSGRPLFRKQVPGALLDPRQSPQPQRLREGGLHSSVPRPLPQLRRAQRRPAVGLSAQLHEFQPEIFGTARHAEGEHGWQDRGREHTVVCSICAGSRHRRKTRCCTPPMAYANCTAWMVIVR